MRVEEPTCRYLRAHGEAIGEEAMLRPSAQIVREPQTAAIAGGMCARREHARPAKRSQGMTEKVMEFAAAGGATPAETQHVRKLAERLAQTERHLFIKEEPTSSPMLS